MDNYYEKLLEDITKYMEEENYEEAYALIEAEFKMPYIPKEYDVKLHELHKTCVSERNTLKKSRKYDDDDIEHLLFGSVDEAFQACELIKNSNIRKYLDVIEDYLNDKPHFVVRSLLVESLIEQNISDEIKLNFDGLDITFIPAYCELPQHQDAFVKAVEQVNAYYENENPTFLMMCIETMMKEVYFKMPFTLSEDEINPFIYAVLRYVYQANGDLEGFEKFILEKKLANYGGYDLLLYEYDI